MFTKNMIVLIACIVASGSVAGQSTAPTCASPDRDGCSSDDSFLNQRAHFQRARTIASNNDAAMVHEKQDEAVLSNSNHLCKQIAQKVEQGAGGLVGLIKKMSKAVLVETGAAHLWASQVQEHVSTLHQDFQASGNDDLALDAASKFCVDKGAKLKTLLSELGGALSQMSLMESSSALHHAPQATESRKESSPRPELGLLNQMQTQFMQFDGFTQTPVPRKPIDGFAKELVSKYPLVGGMRANESTIFLPMTTILDGEYSRDTNALDRRDYGSLKSTLFRNLPSAFGEKVELTFFEKSHTFWDDREIPSATNAKVQAQREQPHSSLLDMFASLKSLRWLKTFVSHMFFAKGFGRQLFAAAYDYKHNDAIRQFVESDRAPGADILLEMEKLDAKFAERASKGAHNLAQHKVLRSSINCVHFEHIDGLVYRDGGVEIPLNKKIVAYRGRQASAPNQEYNMAIGFAILSHAPQTNSLNINYFFSSSTDFADTGHEMVGEFTFGPIDGLSAHAPLGEGRKLAPAIDTTIAKLYTAAQMIPMDYHLLYQSREVECPQSTLEEMRSNAPIIMKMLASRSLPLLVHMTDALPCIIEYLRPEHYTAGPGLWEIASLSHTMCEVPPSLVPDVLAPHVVWNSVQGQELY